MKTGVALGFRVKSGFAIAIVVAGPSKSPRALTRHLVEMSDPDTPGTRQPYHNRTFKTEEDESEITRRATIVRRCAKKSVGALVDELRRSAESLALPPLRAAIVVGSVIDPATIGSLHMRAHANEGRLFRTVLEEALRSQGIACLVIVEKTLATRACADLGRPDREIRKVIDRFGETLGKPWRAEEKAASLAAWLALA